MTERTIVIGLDGLIKPWADPLIAAGAMPNLARLVATGTYASNAFVVVPPLTPANWRSLATGAWVLEIPLIFSTAPEGVPRITPRPASGGGPPHRQRRAVLDRALRLDPDTGGAAVAERGIGEPTRPRPARHRRAGAAEFERVRTRVIELLLDYREPPDGECWSTWRYGARSAQRPGPVGDQVGDVIFFTQTALAGCL